MFDYVTTCSGAQTRDDGSLSRKCSSNHVFAIFNCKEPKRQKKQIIFADKFVSVSKIINRQDVYHMFVHGTIQIQLVAMFEMNNLSIYRHTINIWFGNTRPGSRK